MERIRQLRNEKGLSQVKLAVRADMDPATLNRLEQGKGNPNLKTLERVAEALGVEVADFFPKVQQPLPEEGGERRKHDHRFDSDGEKGVTLEQLHELGIKSNNDDVVVLNHYLGAHDRYAIQPGDWPVDHERVKGILAFLLAIEGMLTEEEREAAHGALYSELVEANG